MLNMDAQPILEVIRSQAKQAVTKLLREAEDRALTIHEQSDLRVAALREETERKAGQEAEQLADRMRRLSLLEERKDLLAAKRALIDRAFKEALARMHGLPDEAVETQVLQMVLQNAAGDELLMPGAVNGGFYTPSFIEKANESLAGMGKPSRLKDSGEVVPGVCGVVLRSESSQTHCTFESLLEGRREALEAGVADVLFPGGKD